MSADAAPVEAGLVERAKFLEDAAKHFENMPTKGEDRAHWANVYNAKNCREISALLTAAIEGQSYWQARAERAESVLVECREQFAKYCAMHKAKKTEDGDLKAAINWLYAGKIDAVLADAQQTQKPEEVRDAS